MSTHWPDPTGIEVAITLGVRCPHVRGLQLAYLEVEPLRVNGIRMGAFDGDPGIRPSVRQFVAYAAPWEPVPDDGLPRHPEGRHPPRQKSIG